MKLAQNTIVTTTSKLNLSLNASHITYTHHFLRRCQVRVLDTFRYAANEFYSKIFFTVYSRLQYVVLGPRLKVINLNILPESSRNELKYSLKIAFMFFLIILKFQVPDINILLGVRKKATVFDGPWSANVVLGLRPTSIPGFSPRSVGRVGENPGNEAGPRLR